MSNPYEKYEIRRARKADLDAIMAFLDQYWKKGHLLATDREFLEYEFMREEEEMDFILAVNKESGEIEGLEGFLCSNSDKNPDVWPSFWKVRDGNAFMLGTEIRRRLDELSGCRYSLGMGDNPNTCAPIMKMVFQREVTTLDHFYKLSGETFRIAKIEREPAARKATIPNSEREITVKQIHTADELERGYSFERTDLVPYKDAWYFRHHYFDNPIYHYDVFGITENDKILAFFVVRMQECNESRCLRIVDYAGEEFLPYMGEFLDRYLVEQHAEYADFYCYGFSKEEMTQAGFTLREKEDKNIIPNFFFPFVQENIDIWIDFPKDISVRYCKGDGDQDRPSVRA